MTPERRMEYAKLKTQSREHGENKGEEARREG